MIRLKYCKDCADENDIEGQRFIISIISYRGRNYTHANNKLVRRERKDDRIVASTLARVVNDNGYTFVDNENFVVDSARMPPPPLLATS